MNAPNAVAAAARSYLDAGFSPFPILGDGTKQPAISWKRLQTERLSPEECDSLFSGSNGIGIAGGSISGDLTIIDIDGGDATYQAYVRRLYECSPGLLERLPIVRTPREDGGYHIYVRARGAGRNEVLARASDDKLLIETRANGGYVIAPGSAPQCHKTGRPYLHFAGPPIEETPTLSPDDASILIETARTLDERPTPPPKPIRSPGVDRHGPLTEAADAAAREFARAWPSEGSRHLASCALAGALGRLGLGAADAEHFVVRVAALAGDEEQPSRRGDVRTTFDKLANGDPCTGWPRLAQLCGEEPTLNLRAALGVGEWVNPAPLSEQRALPEFPSHALPDWMAAYVGQLAVAVQVPVDLPAMLGLGCLAAALAPRFDVSVTPEWREPLCLFLAVAMPPASRKSAASAKMLAPIREFEDSLVRESEAARIEAEQRVAVCAGALKQARGAASKAQAKPPTTKGPPKRPPGEDPMERVLQLSREMEELKPPPSPRLIADDVTPEKVAGMLADQGGALAIFAPEGGGPFSIMAGRYSDKSANFEVFLQGHAGDPIVVDRMTRESLRVHAPRLTVSVTCQPDVIAGIDDIPGARGRGLPARFLFSIPRSIVGTRTVHPPSIEEGTAKAYSEGLRRLLRPPRSGAPRAAVRLSAEANELFEAFQLSLEQRLGPQGDLGSLSDWAGKLAGAVARIAALIHLADLPSPDPEVAVGMSAMRRAIEIGTYLIPHAGGAFGLMRANSIVERAEQVLEWIKRHGAEVVTRRELHQALRGRRDFGQAKALQEPLTLLSDLGYLEPEVAILRRQGRPQTRYRVNPAVLRQEGTTF